MHNLCNIHKKWSMLTSLVLLIIDQISKFLVLNNIGNGDIVNVAPCLNFILTFNQGVTFGLLKANSYVHFILLLTGVCIMSLIVTIWWLRAENTIQRYATALILSGAFGNLIDRLRFHGVVDFIDFHILGYHWYTFNVADAAIVVGVGLLLLDTISKRGVLAK